MSVIDVKVPDIGDFKDVPIIEILVKPGDVVAPETSLMTLESDKAAMDVPAPEGGKVVDVLVKVGDKVSEGKTILRLEPTAAKGKGNGKDDVQGDNSARQTAGRDVSGAPAGEAAAAPARPAAMQAEGEAASSQSRAAKASGGLPPIHDFGSVHASPSVRRLARELDLDLTQISGSGDKGRVTKDDVKRALGGGAKGGMGIPEIPAQDFAKFGPIETQPFSRLKKLSGPHLHRAWLNVPHVTQSDSADVTELEAYRKSLDETGKEKGYRVTLLAFLMKAAVVALKEHPEFNASLTPDKGGLILKKYYNIGVAVDTPDGLVVPAIKDVDRKGILELSQELGDVSQRMRAGKITPADIQGGTFSISSLGGIGGTGFTPIINAPEVAILGVVRAEMKPVWNGKAFEPRLMLPLCLSYDHRAVDGALAARFARRLAEILGDVRQLVL
jgi:pyruvate dehydrogenase E2 component (dihydrolipoamide acetyltransferase)